MGSSRFVVAIVLASSAAQAERGVPVDGFPSYQERMLLVYTNRARADPQADLAGCTSCAESACYPSPLTPVAYSFALNRAARFHGSNLEFTGAFQHDSPCALVSNLPSVYAPTGSCLGEVSCSCVGGTQTGTTSPSTRVAMFQSFSSFGENIAAGNSTPRATFYQWLYEPETSSTCGFRSTNGHRFNILEPSRRLLGAGYFRISRHMWVQDFTGGSTPTGTLLAGGHEPQFTTGSSVEFRVNYFDSAAPQGAVVNVDGTCTTMTLERGGATNATYLGAQTLDTTCHRYRFEFVGPAGATVYLPESGSYGAGGAASGCADWTATAPSPCGAPPNQAPTVMMAASANPATVAATTTQLAVAGADDGGESALTYTWASSGPAAVTFTPNGTNAAKATTATFARAGSYTFTVTIRDAANLTTTSTTNVTVAQTTTAVAVAPSAASVKVSATQQFTRTAFDQFAVALASQPSATWSVSGGGSIDGNGLFTAGQSFGGTYTVTASAGGKQGTAQVSISGPDAPSVAAAAQATPALVRGTTTTVSVLGASGAGEASLTYTWTSAGPAPVTASANGSNDAKTSTVTFQQAGNYTLTATITDATGQTGTSSVDVTVEATPTAIAITPATAVIVIDTAVDFGAAVSDQFGKAAIATPTWSVDGGGTVDSSGHFVAASTPGGPFTLTATAGGATGTAQFVISETADVTAPTLVITSPADGDVVSGPTMMVADAADDLGVARVVFTIGDQMIEAKAAPFQVAWDPAALADGTYQVTAQAFDLAGNQSAPATVTILLARDAGADDPAGCCSGARPGGSGLYALLVGIALRRRRRR